MKTWIYFILAVAGILTLYSISYFSEPIETNLKDIWKYEGEKVIVRGIVKNRAGNILEISDGEARGKIYYKDAEEFQYGDKIEAIGKVGEYAGSLIVFADEIKLIERWNNKTISLPYLAENYLDFINMNVNVIAYIYSIGSGYFYLTDENLEYKIKVYCNETINFEKYEKVRVKALLCYNPKSLSFYLKICKDFHGVEKYE